MSVPRRMLQSPRRPVPAPERPRHLEVVGGRPVPGRRPQTRTVALGLAATGAALFVMVTAHVVLGQSGLGQAELEARVAEKRLRTQQLELEVARLRSPARIAGRARELGLVPATDIVVLAPVRGPSPSRGGR